MNIYVPPRLIPETLALIKHFEGCFLEAYRDPVGVWTIGYGHTAKVKRGQSITPQQAEDLLMEDLDIAQVDVRHNTKVPLNENEFGALVSLAFNIGGSALANSTLIRKLNKGDRQRAAEEFERFVNGHIGGKRVTLRGLVLRRQAEREFFEAAPGTLVRDGRMVLAGRTIPVEHPTYDVASAGPPQPPQHAPYPAPGAGLVAEAVAAVDSFRARRAHGGISRATLIGIGTGAAVGAIPATGTPAAQALAGEVTKVWQLAGGPGVFPGEASWLRWVEAFGEGVSAVFRKGALAPLLTYALEFIRSHEALIVLLVTVALVLFRAGLGRGLFVERRDDRQA